MKFDIRSETAKSQTMTDGLFKRDLKHEKNKKKTRQLTRVASLRDNREAGDERQETRDKGQRTTRREKRERR